MILRLATGSGMPHHWCAALPGPNSVTVLPLSGCSGGVAGQGGGKGTELGNM
jgi:hypothetical protein